MKSLVDKKKRVTRGYGLLERYLAIQRAKMVHKLAGISVANGTVLDIGCGHFPIFLLTSSFIVKHGIDQIDFERVPKALQRRINLVNYDIISGDSLPFENNSMDVITMLAVIEHIEKEKLEKLFVDIRRVLKPKGRCVITVPAPWGEIILRVLAYCHLLSKEEIDDHKSELSKQDIIRLFNGAQFNSYDSGYFECYMNRWFIAYK